MHALLAAAEILATAAAGLFAGAAIYINVAEHPARMECGTAVAAQLFGPSYRRAAVMQGVLAVVGSFAGIVAWRIGAGAAWLAGSALLLSVVPFTLLAVMKTNARLLDGGLDPSSPETRELLVRWGRLHAVRSLAGSLSFLVFLAAR